MEALREIEAALCILPARTADTMTSPRLDMVRVRGARVRRVTLVTMTWLERGGEIWDYLQKPAVEAPTARDGVVEV